jgi:pilus assembly protein Flp/PilA
MKLRTFRARLETFLAQDEQGQGLSEYALILGLIAVVAIVALLYMGSQVSDKLSVIGSTLQSVAN